MPENNRMPEKEIQNILFQNWLSEIKKLPKRRDYKIPAKITELPCGCSRERNNEIDPNNTWKAVCKNGEYFHKECGKTLGK